MDRFLIDDPCSLLGLVVLLLAIGKLISHGKPRLRGIADRFAGVAFFAYVAYAGYAKGALYPEMWLGIVFYGLLAGGFALGIASIALPLIALAHALVVKRPAAAFRRHRRERDRRRRDAEARAEAERKAAADRAAWEAAAPERERARIEADEAARRKADAQRRRADALARALLDYTFYAAKLGDRFRREDFDLYVDTFMKDEPDADVVERRGRELVEILQRHLADAEPPAPAATVESLAAWYRAQEERIKAMPIDERVRGVNLIMLRRRFEDLLKQHLMDGQP